MLDGELESGRTAHSKCSIAIKEHNHEGDCQLMYHAPLS